MRDLPSSYHGHALLWVAVVRDVETAACAWTSQETPPQPLRR